MDLHEPDEWLCVLYLWLQLPADLQRISLNVVEGQPLLDQVAATYEARLCTHEQPGPRN